MFEQFKLPGMDMGAVMEARRKDIEALGEANKLAYEGMQALMQKQTEIFGQAMQQIQAAAQQMSTGSNPAEAMAQQNEFVQKALQQALENMRQLAEMASKSQAEAMAVIATAPSRTCRKRGTCSSRRQAESLSSPHLTSPHLTSSPQLTSAIAGGIRRLSGLPHQLPQTAILASPGGGPERLDFYQDAKATRSLQYCCN